MNNAEKSAIKSGGLFGLLGAAVIVPIATPVLWASLGYGMYHVAKAAYRNAKLKDVPPGGELEDNLFF
jgi:hypothetical protein